MVASSALLTFSDATSKWLTADYPSTQVWFFRTLFFVTPILVLVAARSHWAELRIHRGGAQLTRGILFALTTLLLIMSLSVMPLVNVIAIVFASPLIVAALGPVFLREPTPRARWSAIAVGFTGMLLIVQPSAPTLGWLILLPVAATVCSALRDVVTRKVSVTESSLSLLFYSGLIVLAVGGALAPWSNWQPVQPRDWALFVLNGLLNGGAHFLLIEALRIGQASLVAPFKYSGLLFGLILGYWLWGDLPGMPAIAGAAAIVAACLYLLGLERQQSGSDRH